MNQEYKKIKQELYRQSPRFEQLQRKVFLRFLVKVALAEALVIAFAVGSYLLAPSAAIAFVIIGIAVLWYFLKKSKLIGNRILGTVTHIKRDNVRVESEYIRRMTDRNLSFFTVTAPNGKTTIVVLPVRYEKVFKKGDKIIRLAGMEYPVDLTPDELVLCPFCGNIFPTENEVCVECGEPALNANVIREID